MYSVISLALVLLAADSGIEVTHSATGHIARVRLDIGSFNPKQHTVKRVGYCYEIDGQREPLGVDCGLPKFETRKLSVWIDGVALTIPKRFYNDCFNPSPGNELTIRIADDGQAAFVFFQGSDAAGGYRMVWAFRLDGRHSRTSCGPSECSDGDAGLKPTL
jgi:hypothetical protein